MPEKKVTVVTDEDGYIHRVYLGNKSKAKKALLKDVDFFMGANPAERKEMLNDFDYNETYLHEPAKKKKLKRLS